MTEADLAAYQALRRRAAVVRMEWADRAHAAADGRRRDGPGNAWQSSRPSSGTNGTEALPNWLTGRLEALRLAWDDRLRFFGDPTKVDVPARSVAERPHMPKSWPTKVAIALRDNKPAPAQTDNRSADGTQHLSAVDSNGTMVAITLTHGGYYGAQVTVDGLGPDAGSRHVAVQYASRAIPIPSPRANGRCTT